MTNSVQSFVHDPITTISNENTSGLENLEDMCLHGQCLLSTESNLQPHTGE